MNPAVNSSPRAPGRPPSQKARAAIIRAACEIIEERGLTGVTMEGVAVLAGVGKPTVYRHFADRHELAMAALMQMSAPEDRKTRRGSPLHELKRQLLAMAALFESKTGQFVATVLASGHGETEMSKAFRHHFVEQRREESRTLLEEAQQTGVIVPDVDVEIALDQLYGPVIYRLLIARSPIDREFVEKLFDQLIKGIGQVSDELDGSFSRHD